MKNLNLLAIAISFCGIAFCTPAKAVAPRVSNVVSSFTGTPDKDTLEIVQIEKRMNEIRNMDISNISPAERHALHVEIKQMMKQVKVHTRHPYLIGNIASGGIAAFILVTLVAMLRLV